LEKLIGRSSGELGAKFTGAQITGDCVQKQTVSDDFPGSTRQLVCKAGFLHVAVIVLCADMNSATRSRVRLEEVRCSRPRFTPSALTDHLLQSSVNRIVTFLVQAVCGTA
jgi:hypothetical protein